MVKMVTKGAVVFIIETFCCNLHVVFGWYLAKCNNCNNTLLIGIPECLQDI